MDTTHILAFVDAIKDLFDTMLRTPVTVKKPHPKASNAPSFAVSGLIGVNGSVTGTIILSFPESLAEQLVKRFVGVEVPCGDPDFADAVGELANIVAGGAKSRFSDPEATISCPSVVVGENHKVMHRKDAPIIVIPCVCEFGEFNVEISVRRQAAKKAGGDFAKAG